MSKHLPVLEAEGAVVRTVGGRQGRRRLPDTWALAPVTPAGEPGADQEVSTSGSSGGTVGTTSPSPSETVPAGEATATATSLEVAVAEPQQAPAAPAESAPSTPRVTTPRVRSRVGAVEPGAATRSAGPCAWRRAMRAWVADQDWLSLERLPAYAPELNPVEMLWSAIKSRELANLAGDHLADVADAAERDINRVCEDERLPWSFLTHVGLEIHPPTPHN